ncbi:MAG: fructosamine kinase family protein [Ornithinimicrobium sp.]
MPGSWELPSALTVGLEVSEVHEVVGGSIAQVYRLQVGPEQLFAKTLTGAPSDFFDREAMGLGVLRETGTVQVPRVVRHTSVGLLLEWIPQCQPMRHSAASDEQFGRELAALHDTHGPHFGSVEDVHIGYLGSLQLDLSPEPTYYASYLVRRVLPLVKAAVSGDRIDPTALRLVDRLLECGPQVCGPPEPPSLVHGDLWSGNRVVAADARNWLVDPSAHYGHREFDLALMRLMGGFGERVFAAYAEVSPLAPGWEERLDIHQLVPLLVNSLMFGERYSTQIMARLERLAH